MSTDKNERRESIVARLREALYLSDGHADLNDYEAFMQTAVEWGNARYAEMQAEEDGED